MTVRIFAPAKINLTLQVGARRADGMHPLQSVVMFADVGDWIEVEPADGRLSLEISGEFASALDDGGENLVLKAARALADEARMQSPGARIGLEKNLPVASGIGGGSSDAAATLKALNILWGLNIPTADLMRVALRVGADAPVCVHTRSAWMTGIGDMISDLQAPSLHAVLVNPLKPLATASVFREFDRMAGAASLPIQGAPSWASAADAIDGIRAAGNDLLDAARFLLPEIGEIEEALGDDRRVLCASMSGSGATMFALVRDMSDARALATDVADSHPQWWVRAAALGAA